MSDKICIIGLGYVGLPIAVEFAKKYDVIGYDVNKQRIEELKNGFDGTNEVSNEQLNQKLSINFTSSQNDIEKCNLYIITVPTPVNSSNVPDFSHLISASEVVGASLKKGDIVCYESTVFPGATEEVCLPILEDKSGLLMNSDFGLGYSPERINPGDKTHKLSNIVKVVAGSNDITLNKLKQIYSSIVDAGIHCAPNIKTAEAAKVIENTQRDVNIALINEIAIICNKLDIDTHDVLKAAGTKWNFLNFEPGLVGGHCIGVDPYYLAHKATTIGHNPEIILAGRRINDEMPNYVAQQILGLLIKTKQNFEDLKILLLGLTFKENCPDTRNSKSIDLYQNLVGHNLDVDVYDPYIKEDQNITPINKTKVLDSLSNDKKYHAVILTVPHNIFLEKSFLKILHNIIHKDGLIYDLKGVLPREFEAIRL